MNRLLFHLAQSYNKSRQLFFYIDYNTVIIYTKDITIISKKSTTEDLFCLNCINGLDSSRLDCSKTVGDE